MPQFPGGNFALDDYIVSHIKYPRYCKQNKMEGIVYLQIVVNSKGRVANVILLHPVQPQLDAEAMRVVTHLPKWKPGKKDGKTADIPVTVAVRFKIDQKN